MNRNDTTSEYEQQWLLPCYPWTWLLVQEQLSSGTTFELPRSAYTGNWSSNLRLRFSGKLYENSFRFRLLNPERRALLRKIEKEQKMQLESESTSSKEL